MQIENVAKSMKQDFLMLAHTFNPQRHNVSRWFWSYKMDGMRAVWIPSTRGRPMVHVPFANIDKSHTNHMSDIATGLWSRRGKVIFAPDSFLDALPTFPVDGELIHPSGFQATVSVCRDRVPSSGWSDIKFYVIDLPEEGILLAKRELPWETRFDRNSFTIAHPFVTRIGKIQSLENTVLVPIRQENVTGAGKEYFNNLLNQAVENNYEGLVFRNPVSTYVTQRSRQMLKWKPFSDMDGIVVGVEIGEGKYTGMLGALVVDIGGNQTVKLGTGLTDSERSLPLSSWIGKTVTFRYRVLSTDGIPREGRFWRIRSD